MVSKIFRLAVLTGVGMALGMPSAFAGYFQPGETMGASLCSPLPQGVYLADLDDQGAGDKQPQTNVGISQPTIIWSTPLEFYNTRLSIIAVSPVARFSGPTVNTITSVTQAIGGLFGHDFGGGLTGGVGFILKTATPNTYTRDFIDGRTINELDSRESMQYTFNADQGILSGVTVIQNLGITTAAGQNYSGPLAQNDLLAVDFALEKSIGKFTFGVTGFYNTDLDKRNQTFRSASAEIGPLIGYNFGTFNVTGIVTRSVYVKGGVNGISDTVASGYETRGWVRIVIPILAGAAPAAPVVAKY